MEAPEASVMRAARSRPDSEASAMEKRRRGQVAAKRKELGEGGKRAGLRIED